MRIFEAEKEKLLRNAAPQMEPLLELFPIYRESDWRQLEKAPKSSTTLRLTKEKIIKIMIYYHKFEVRWSDIDANRHLANSSYVQYCAQARMAFMTKHKMGVSQLNRWGIGPVILHERYSFFKEIYADQEVVVSLEISGSSEDASIYQFTHKFYLPDGTHCATAEATGVWIDMMLRKATTPPDDILVIMNQFKSERTKLLSKDDIKALPFRPENIDDSQFDFNR